MLIHVYHGEGELRRPTDGAISQPMQGEPISESIGLQLGPYRLVRALGHGAMASVYEAVHEVLGKTVAIKLLHPHLARNEVVVARFEREGRAAARVRHPHVVDVHDVVLDARRPFLVLELVEGPPLATLMRGAPLSPSETLDLLLPVCAAVARAHDAGVIHRDLKPGNIIVARDRDGGWLPKVTDFGISKVVDQLEDRDLTKDDGLLGTLGYAAPEQVRAPNAVDDAADQYAIAVILYEALTGRRPFESSSTWTLMQSILKGGAAPIRERAPDVPRELEALVMRALARDPSDRHPDVRSFGAALLPFASPPTRARFSTELFTDDPGVSATVHPTADRPRAMAWARPALVAAAVVFAVVLATRLPHRAESPARPADVAPPPLATEVAVAPAVASPATSALANVAASTSVVRKPVVTAKPAKATTASVAPPAPTPTPVVTQPKIEMGDNEAPIVE